MPQACLRDGCEVGRARPPLPGSSPGWHGTKVWGWVMGCTLLNLLGVTLGTEAFATQPGGGDRPVLVAS